MFPQLPKSADDLVPLPRIDGPKLKAFNFQGPQKIEFLELLGDGLHSYVFKVRILGQIYALKVFRFIFDWEWGGSETMEIEDEDFAAAAGQYSEPFYAECRAFGRLQETGHEELAVKCFGYVLLDDDHERALYKLFDGRLGRHASRLFLGSDSSVGSEEELRNRFQGDDTRSPPLRAIVKEFGSPTEETFGARDFRKMLRDIVRLHQLGIVKVDPASRQIINGKMCDFSTALTTPHFWLTAELNPYLTPEMKTNLEFDAFLWTIQDYWEYDEEIKRWIEERGPKVKGNLASAFAFYQGRGLMRNTSSLRVKPHRKAVVTTFVDPRRFNWKAYSNASGVARKARATLSRAPPRWNYTCKEQKEYDKIVRKAICSTYISSWHFKGGYITLSKPGE